MVKMMRKPTVKSVGTFQRARSPAMIVAIQAKTWMPAGMETAIDAAEKKPVEMGGRPVVNMWWTHRPKLLKPVAKIGRAWGRERVGTCLVDLGGRRYIKKKKDTT